MPHFIDHPSPNRDERPADIDMIVLHYTGMPSGEAAIALLCDPESKVSAHYVVEEDGRIFALVPEEARAWHAGVSHWQGRDKLNDVSVGIEIINPGHEWGYRPFPESQIASVIDLVADIKKRQQVAASRVVAHSDIAPERKEDPGELFPWNRLAEKGLAMAQPGPECLEDQNVPSYSDCLSMLSHIGYRVIDNQHAAPVLAFQRRFLPVALGQGLDRRTRQAITAVHQAAFQNS